MESKKRDIKMAQIELKVELRYKEPCFSDVDVSCSGIAHFTFQLS